MPDMSFEEAMAALEQIVNRLEQGELGLDQSLQLFEQGVALVRYCSRQLDEAERKIQLLLEQNGNVVLESAPDLEPGDPGDVEAGSDARDATA